VGKHAIVALVDNDDVPARQQRREQDAGNVDWRCLGSFAASARLPHHRVRCMDDQSPQSNWRTSDLISKF
jgi:hypothetical protein